MKQWSREIEINASIEVVWSLFNGSLEEMQKIMPQVIENKLIKETPDKIGSIYLQVYQEGKRTQQYEVKTLDYLDTEDKKKLKIGFNLANMFDITADYELIKLDEYKTLFKYTATNNPLKWFVKLAVKLANDKIVIQFTERVKEVAEEKSKTAIH
ncbi:SRPBCC family protein [Bacillus sp. CGMCC 1.16607]|uniref:SRPBCC family protein n=1 Tax=Bacillus sp. CGMCC 1.16607 TaxID=3351842 RepID=UPI003636BBBD